jgi:hypothetical protein
MIGFSDTNKYFGGPGFISISFMIATIGFALTSIWSLIYVIKVRNEEINKFVYWYSTILAFLHVLITIYLFSFDMIGIRVWS